MNFFDSIIVIVSWIEITLLDGGGTSAMMAFRAIRVFRVFRVLRITKILKQLAFMKVIIGCLCRSY